MIKKCDESKRTKRVVKQVVAITKNELFRKMKKMVLIEECSRLRRIIAGMEVEYADMKSSRDSWVLRSNTAEEKATRFMHKDSLFKRLKKAWYGVL